MDTNIYNVEGQGQTYANATVTATPVNGGPVPSNNVSPELQETLNSTAEAIRSSLEGFSDQVENLCGDCSAQQEEQVKQATGLFQRFQEYISSKGFRDNVNMTARKYGVPPKKVAEGFFGKVLGTIGDVAGIAVSTAGNIAHSFIDIFAAILHGGVNMVVSAASALVRVLTLNNTCIVNA